MPLVVAFLLEINVLATDADLRSKDRWIKFLRNQLTPLLPIMDAVNFRDPTQDDSRCCSTHALTPLPGRLPGPGIGCPFGLSAGLPPGPDVPLGDPGPLSPPKGPGDICIFRNDCWRASLSDS